MFIDGMLSAPYSPAVLSSFVSDGILFANSSKKYEKMPPETDGFWTSFTVKRLACYGTVKGIESATDPLPLPLR